MSRSEDMPRPTTPQRDMFFSDVSRVDAEGARTSTGLASTMALVLVLSKSAAGLGTWRRPRQWPREAAVIRAGTLERARRYWMIRRRLDYFCGRTTIRRGGW